MARAIISISLIVAGVILLVVAVAQTPEPYWAVKLVPLLWATGGLVALLGDEK